MLATYGLLDSFSYGRGAQNVVPVATPAAGATQSVTVPGEYVYRVLAARVSLTTDANAANRLLTLDYVDPRGNTYVQNGAGLVVTANTSAQVFQWSRGRTVAEWAANTPVFCPLDSVFLAPGWVIRWNVANIQVGDTLTALRLLVEQYETGDRGYVLGVANDGRD